MRRGTARCLLMKLSFEYHEVPDCAVRLRQHHVSARPDERRGEERRTPNLLHGSGIPAAQLSSALQLQRLGRRWMPYTASLRGTSAPGVTAGNPSSTHVLSQEPEQSRLAAPRAPRQERRSTECTATALHSQSINYPRPAPVMSYAHNLCNS